MQQRTPAIKSTVIPVLFNTACICNALSTPLGAARDVYSYGQAQPPASGPDICPKFVGQPDLYGLGIRLGVYFQLFSSLLANYYHPEMLQDAWDTNLIFLVAVFIAVVRSAVVHELRPVEGVIMLQMLMAFILSVVSTSVPLAWRFISQLGKLDLFYLPDDFKELIAAYSTSTTLGIAARLCLQAAIASFQVYFWFDLVNRGNDCDGYIFLFARVRLSTPPKRFFQALVTIYMLYVGLRFFMTVLSNLAAVPWLELRRYFVEQRWKKGSNISKFLYATRERYLQVGIAKPLGALDGREAWNVAAKRNTGRILQYLRLFLLSYDALIVIWSILTIELTLRFNSIEGVNFLANTGQLIPFIIGLFGFLRTLHLIFLQTLLEGKEMSKAKRLPISVNKDKGNWKYLLRDGRIALFDARGRDLKRRWSVGCCSINKLGNDRQLHPRILFRDEPTPPPGLLQPRMSDELSSLYGHRSVRKRKSASSCKSAPTRLKADAEHSTLGQQEFTRHWSFDDDHCIEADGGMKTFDWEAGMRHVEDIETRRHIREDLRRVRRAFKIPIVRDHTARFHYKSQIDKQHDLELRAVPLERMRQGWIHGSVDDVLNRPESGRRRSSDELSSSAQSLTSSEAVEQGFMTVEERRKRRTKDRMKLFLRIIIRLWDAPMPIRPFAMMLIFPFILLVILTCTVYIVFSMICEDIETIWRGLYQKPMAGSEAES